MSFSNSNFKLFFGEITFKFLSSSISPEKLTKPYILNSFCNSVVKLGLIIFSKSYKKNFHKLDLMILNQLLLIIFLIDDIVRLNILLFFQEGDVFLIEADLLVSVIISVFFEVLTLLSKT